MVKAQQMKWLVECKSNVTGPDSPALIHLKNCLSLFLCVLFPTSAAL